MTYPHGGASEIWRDGVDNAHNPRKPEIRDWGGKVEADAVEQAARLLQLEERDQLTPNPKAPVAAATLSNITLTGEQTIDGVTTSASRVLVRAQNDATENGIYVSAAGAWARAADADDGSALSWATVLVADGAQFGGTAFISAVASPTIGSDSIPWIQIEAVASFEGRVNDAEADIADLQDSRRAAAQAAVIYTGAGPIYPFASDAELGPVLWWDVSAQSVDGLGLRRGADEGTRNREDLALAAASGSKIAFFTYGQSLSTGKDANPALSLAQPYSNVMFNGGALPGATDGAAEDDPSLYASFVPLVEETEETPVSGAVNYARTLAAIENGEDPNAVAILGAALGKGGAPIAGLSKGTTHYDDVILAGALQGMVAIDPQYKLTAFGWLQGEADQTNQTDKATYKAALLQLQQDIEADAQAQTGQTEPVYCLTYQTNKDTIERTDVPAAQLELARESDRIFLVTPLYHLPFAAGGLHLSAVGSKWAGAYAGRALKQLGDGKVPDRIDPISATVRGSTLTMRFDVPVLPLRFDRTAMAATIDNGFRVVDSAGTVAIDSMTIQGRDVVFELAAMPSGATVLRYGHDYTGAGLLIANQNGGSGNLRDSAPEVERIDGVDRPLHNVCPQFEIPVFSVSE
ncbi:sialate O-acetylesterase [Shimia ponticola]|uniref:sialate O-acetylesterase n=1 Tax=Shimia ponticola TaxID=2582893 RepID=UPI0011BD59BC|nr:sialate O-acetylesterase [Shimia ponticola]